MTSHVTHTADGDGADDLAALYPVGITADKGIGRSPLPSGDCVDGFTMGWATEDANHESILLAFGHIIHTAGRCKGDIRYVLDSNNP